MPYAECPGPELLAAYRDGGLGSAEHHDISEHVAACPNCRRFLDDLGDSAPNMRADPPRPAGCEAASSRSASALGGEEIEPPAASSDELAATQTYIEPQLGCVRDYLLLEKLGEGGMGIVYKARHQKLEKIVALKVVSTNRIEDATAISRFLREMKAVGRLNHANIVAAFDAGEFEGAHYLVMEYVEGTDLASLIRRIGCPSIADAAEIIRQAAVALEHIHEHGLIHRDLKLSNLMLAEAGQVKILDLGLALLREPGDTDDELTRRRGHGDD